MIKLYMYKEKWRIQIGDEVWEFESMKECYCVLNDLMFFKEAYGKLGTKK